MMEPLFERLKQNAIARPQRIVLPESTEPRTLQAAEMAIIDEIANIILIGNREEILSKAKELGMTHIDQATIVDNNDKDFVEKYAQLFFELRKNKGITIDDARRTASNPLYLGCLMIKNGDADGQVAGAQNTTGNVLRAAFQVLKTAPGVSVVSGAFIMMLPQHLPYGENHTLVFADCAVVPSPNAEELAQIAISSAKTARDLVGIEPHIAMLSFSTKGSAKHDCVDKVIEATKLVQKLDPSLDIDGELQADAAIVPSVAATKAPGSKVAGHANVLIFPSIEVGNIAYKLVQRLGEIEAVGPVLQGLAAPVNDLSRGCSPTDIYKTLLLTTNQAINRIK